jgi:hypothetical protein
MNEFVELCAGQTLITRMYRNDTSQVVVLSHDELAKLFFAGEAEGLAKVANDAQAFSASETKPPFLQGIEKAIQDAAKTEAVAKPKFPKTYSAWVKEEKLKDVSPVFAQISGTKWSPERAELTFFSADNAIGTDEARSIVYNAMRDKLAFEGELLFKVQAPESVAPVENADATVPNEKAKTSKAESTSAEAPKEKTPPAVITIEQLTAVCVKTAKKLGGDEAAKTKVRSIVKDVGGFDSLKEVPAAKYAAIEEQLNQVGETLGTPDEF